MSPRPPKGEGIPADSFSVTAGSSSTAQTDRMYEILQRVTAIERSIVYLEAQSQNADHKLDNLTEDIISAKAAFKVLKWIFGIFGAICVALWGVVTVLIGMMAKHYLGW